MHPSRAKHPGVKGCRGMSGIGAQLGTLKNLWDAAGGAFTGFLVKLGEAIAPQVKSLTEWISNVSDGLGKWAAENPRLSGTLMTLAGGLAIVLALGGVFMLTTHGSLTNMAVSPAALVVGIISAFCVVIYTIWPQNLQKQYPTPMLQGWAFLMGGTFFALVFRPWRMNYVPNAAGIAGIAAVVLIGNVLAFSCYMSGVKYIGPQKSSLFSFAEPVTAAIISTLVLGSPFTVWDAIGFVCIFLMLVLLFISNEKQAKSAASA